MRHWVDPQSHLSPAFRLTASLVVGVILAGAGGAILGEWTFQSEGTPWMALSLAVGLGALMAWVMNRVWAHEPPRWMMVVAALLAMAGEAYAVQLDREGVQPWPSEGWLAVALAGTAAAYGVHAAHRMAERKRAKGD